MKIYLACASDNVVWWYFLAFIWMGEHQPFIEILGGTFRRIFSCEMRSGGCLGRGQVGGPIRQIDEWYLDLDDGL